MKTPGLLTRTHPTRLSRSIRQATATLALFTLAACGGGNDDASPASSTAKSYTGVVTAYSNPQRFSIDGVPVDASGALVAAQGLATGVRVEIHGDVVNGMWLARRVELDDDSDLDDDSRDDNELEGRVTAYNSPTSFSVDGIAVDASATPTSLTLGAQVEVYGTIVNGVMQATRVKLEDDDNEDDDEGDEQDDDSGDGDDDQDDDADDDKRRS